MNESFPRILYNCPKVDSMKALEAPNSAMTHIQKIEHIFCVTDGLLRDLPALERRIISGHSRQKFRVHLGHLRLVIIVFRVQHPVIISNDQHFRLPGLCLSRVPQGTQETLPGIRRISFVRHVQVAVFVRQFLHGLHHLPQVTLRVVVHMSVQRIAEHEPRRNRERDQKKHHRKEYLHPDT